VYQSIRPRHPLTFDIEELDALILGAQMVESSGDKELVRAARHAIDKVKSVLPDSLQREIVDTSLFSLPT